MSTEDSDFVTGQSCSTHHDVNIKNKSESISQQSHQSKHENSPTVTFVIESTDNDPIGTADDDLQGTFVVTSSNEPPQSTNSDVSDQGIDKVLTLAVCHPNTRGSGVTTDKKAVLHKEKGVNHFENNEEHSNNLHVNKDSPHKQEENQLTKTDPATPKSKCNEILKTDINTEGVIKPRVHGKRPGSKTTRKFHDPVLVQIDETFVDNESVKRNNKVESGTRGLSVNPPGLSASLSELSREHKQSTGEILPNRSLLSHDNGLKKNHLSGRRSVMVTSTTPIDNEDNRLRAINTDERTSTANGYSINTGIERCNRRRRHGNVNTNLRRNNVISRSLDRSLNIIDSHNRIEYSERHRPVSVFEQRYTHHELRRALPRRSFFSCHDKAIKDAGFETDDPVAKRKAERLKARLERIANEFTPLPSTRKSDDQANIEIQGVETITDADNGMANGATHDKSDNEQDQTDEGTSAVAVDEAISDVTTKAEASKVSVKTKKKRPESGKLDHNHIDCKPLLQYLEYVKDNQEEYLNHRNTYLPPPKTKPVARLISLGKAFELRHLGGVPRRQDNDVIVMAAKALRPRTSDPAKYTRHDRDKRPNSSGLRAHESIRQGRPTSEDKRRQEKNTNSKEEEHARSELERKKLRAEEWTKSVSTNTLTKAKIQSLRELGADDNELMKWWEAFKQCHYLRASKPLEERVL